MIIFKTRQSLHQYLEFCRSNQRTIGFVPTMGALHQGHLELIKTAAARCQVVVCSIFINPTQFNDPADFQKYPKTIEADIRLLEASNTTVLFLPEVEELYPSGTSELEHYDLGYLETVLEGSFRPGHFQGVAQVMRRLLQAVNADFLFMGQKDYQQCMVVNRLLQLTNSHTALLTCPTVREADGLAMSSRNKRLNAQERQNATAISRSLTYLRQHLKPGKLDSLKAEAQRQLLAHGFKVDYVEFANSDTLELINEWNGTMPLVALIAAFQNEVRLIDNMLMHAEKAI